MVTDPAGRPYDHGYDPNGNRQSLAHPNGAETAYAYDTLNRLTNLSTNHPSSSRFIQSYAFTLGPAGNRTRIVEAQGLPQQRTLDYSYDALYRLTGESVTESLGLAYSKTFGYDPVGNRQTQITALGPAGSPGPNLQPGTISYGYDTRDRLLQEQLGANPATAYGWDSNGNLTTKDAEATYTWNHENRLTRVDEDRRHGRRAHLRRRRHPRPDGDDAARRPHDDHGLPRRHVRLPEPRRRRVRLVGSQSDAPGPVRPRRRPAVRHAAAGRRSCISD